MRQANVRAPGDVSSKVAATPRIVEGKVNLRLVEFHVVHHCNLTCTACSHHSPQAARGFVSEEELAEDLRLAAQRLDPDCIHVLGGEPLLHSNLPVLLRLFRPAFPRAEIKLVTNGVLVARRAEALLPLLREENITLAVSVYPTVNLDTAEITDLCTAHDTKLELWEQNTFLDFLDTEGGSDPRQARLECPMEDACNVRNGRLYPCPVTAWADFGNFPFNPQDGVSLLAEAPEVAEVLDRNRVTSLCRFCRIDAPRMPHAMTGRSTRRSGPD